MSRAPKDIDALRKQAKKGNAIAQCDLGKICFYRKEYIEAANWFLIAAKSGNVSAQSHFGICLREGKGVPKDEKDAEFWFKKAAGRGDAVAQFNMGDICFERKDFRDAVKWYRRSAEGGHIYSMLRLADSLTRKLKGVTFDAEDAKKWFHTVEETLTAGKDFSEISGFDAKILNSLSRCYSEGRNNEKLVAKDELKAKYWSDLYQQITNPTKTEETVDPPVAPETRQPKVLIDDPVISFPVINEASSSDRIKKVFGEGGAITKKLGGRFRPMQLKLATKIDETIQDKKCLMAEAGTGIGKTLSYLFPALYSGGKVIISTQTTTLQDQLLNDDIPKAEKIWGSDFDVAVLKGRGNYLCLDRLYKTIERPEIFVDLFGNEQGENAVVYRVYEDVQQGKLQTGEQGEIHWLNDDVGSQGRVWSRIKCTAESCPGLGTDKCPYIEQCFLKRARDAALRARIVIVNHHLYLTNLRLLRQQEANNQENPESLLPRTVAATIFDEAHHIPDIAIEVFGDSLSAKIFKGLTDDILQELASVGGEMMGDFHQMASRINLRFKQMLSPQIGAFLGANGRYLETSDLRSNPQLEDFRQALDCLEEDMVAFSELIGSRAERTENLKKYANTLDGYVSFICSWRKSVYGNNAEDEELPPQPEADQYVCWIDIENDALRLRKAPISAADRLAREFNDSSKAWIFTSATLAVKKDNRADFSYFSERMGLNEPDTISVASPFDYHKNSRLYVPKHEDFCFDSPPINESNRRLVLPETNEMYWDELIKSVIPLIQACHGGVLILCTSLNAVSYLGEKFHSHDFKKLLRDRRIFVQGDGNKAQILNGFRESGNAVLVGTKSFWEGIDIPGNALALVVIEKLPFMAPSPHFNARASRMNEKHHNPWAGFNYISKPECKITLKQGVGRLIRSETDKGLLMICDRRILWQGYGKEIRNDLPYAMPILNRQEALDFLQSIAAG